MSCKQKNRALDCHAQSTDGQGTAGIAGSGSKACGLCRYEAEKLSTTRSIVPIGEDNESLTADVPPTYPVAKGSQ